jgi:alpha-1,2-mannosyltransferase
MLWAQMSSLPQHASTGGTAAATGLAGSPQAGPSAATAPARRMPDWMLLAGGITFVLSLTIMAAVYGANPAHLWSMIDLQIYRWGGQLVVHSGNLYGSRFPHTNLYFTYTPMAAAIFAALSELGQNALKLVVTSVSIAALVTTLWLTWGKLGYRASAGRLGATLGMAGVALWLEPVQQTLQFGQINLVLMVIIVADLCCAKSRWYKGVGVGIAAGIKLTPLIFMPYLLLTRQFRAAAVSVATFGVTIAGSLVLLPRESHQFWLDRLFLNSSRVGNLAYVGNQSLNGTLSRLAGSPTAATPYWLACALVIGAAGLALAAWTTWRGHEMLGILVCALTELLVSPVSWSHHWVWVAPGLAALVNLAVTGRHRLLGWLAAIAFFALFFAYPLTMNNGAPGGPLLPQGLIWTVSGSAFQGTGAHGLQLLTGNLYTVVGLVLLCLAGATLVKTRHRVPLAEYIKGLRRGFTRVSLELPTSDGRS